MSSHNIPFFNDIPTKAIAPAARLWNAARNPAYNGMKAYADFIAECNDLGVTPPVKAVVKRFVAGVQAGLIPMPEHAEKTVSRPSVVASAKAYFDNLPDAAAAAVQAAWDRANDDAFPKRNSFDMFCRDINELGHAAPNRGEYDAWWTAVRKGEVERPERQIVEDETVVDGDGAPTDFNDAAVTVSDILFAETATAPEAAPEAPAPSTLSYKLRKVYQGLLQLRGILYGHSDLAPYEGKTVLVGYQADGGLIAEIVVRETDEQGVPGAFICFAPRQAVDVFRPSTKGADELKHRLQATSISCGLNDLTTRDFIPLTPADFAPAALPATKMLVTPLAEIQEGITAQLRNAGEAMINETEEKLRAGLRRQAELLVAAELRAMAEELSARAA